MQIAGTYWSAGGVAAVLSMAAFGLCAAVPKSAVNTLELAAMLTLCLGLIYALGGLLSAIEWAGHQLQ